MCIICAYERERERARELASERERESERASERASERERESEISRKRERERGDIDPFSSRCVIIDST